MGEYIGNTEGTLVESIHIPFVGVINGFYLDGTIVTVSVVVVITTTTAAAAAPHGLFLKVV